MKYTVRWLILQVLILIGVPVASIFVLPPEAGMMGMLVMFLGINPIFFAVQGVSMGDDVKHRWFLLPLGLGIFTLGLWLLDAAIKEVMVYTLLYLVVGLITAAISCFVQKKR